MAKINFQTVNGSFNFARCPNWLTASDKGGVTGESPAVLHTVSWRGHVPERLSAWERGSVRLDRGSAYETDKVISGKGIWRGQTHHSRKKPCECRGA